ncbi:hypothetical protein [Campylobacter porcelli]|nr:MULTISPECIES: hypothetical protein [unclassified Campylobacter]
MYKFSKVNVEIRLIVLFVTKFNSSLVKTLSVYMYLYQRDE